MISPSILLVSLTFCSMQCELMRLRLDATKLLKVCILRLYLNCYLATELFHIGGRSLSIACSFRLACIT